MTDLTWPTTADERLRAQVHTLVGAVVDLGGAIGWLTPPPRAETDGWLDGVLDRGDVLCCLQDGEGLAALGTLVRGSGIFAHGGELRKVMTHPRTRGRGHARTVTAALLDRARADGWENVTLGVRGNNARAIALYADLGFVEVGRYPNTIAVGAERFDDVRMMLTLGHPAGVVLRGSGPGGPGS